MLLRNLFIKHHFTSSHLHNNELINGMRIWRAVRGEGSELGNRSRARGTPLAQGEGPSSAFGPDPEAPQNCLSWDSSQIVAKRPPKIAWLRADGMLDTACNDATASWRKKRLLLKCAAAAAWGGEGGGEGRHCCGSGEILMELLREQTLLRQ